MPRSWQDALLAYLEPHATHDHLSGPQHNVILLSDDRVVVIEDKYPKARVHLLVIARDTSLGSVLDLRPAHVELLEHMRNAGSRAVGEKFGDPRHASSSDVVGREGESSIQVMMGFHAKPSLKPLHMHVVSRDLEKVTTKKHYLSFADPDFFLDVEWVCSELRERGRVVYDMADKERVLKRPVPDWNKKRGGDRAMGAHPTT